MTSLRLRASALGPAVLVGLVAGIPILWILARPSGQPDSRFAGEILGVEALLFFSCSLVLVTLLPPLERAFGGLDRVAVWHRRTAIAGLLLLLPHDALASSVADRYATPLGSGLGSLSLGGLLLLGLWAVAPRLRAARRPGPVRWLARVAYERWLTGHRLTGIFVATAVAHGAIVDPVLRNSTLLLVTYAVVGGIGILAYVYRELFARFVVPVYDYKVSSVDRLNENTIDVALEPVRAPLSFTAGQFVFLAVGGRGGWQRHPFTVSSAPSTRTLGLSIKALGDYTNRLYEKLEPGAPAKIAGPFGAFDYHPGGHRQLWIAGGIGITPFVSWVRALNGTFDRDVDLYYSVASRSDALYLDELQAAATAHPSLRVHLVDTSRDRLLQASTMLDGQNGPGPWVYMCGPPAMMRSLSRGFRREGVPPGHIRWEEFDVR
jgi:predicted ferric reductase